jgi:pimeloyl-ACP methyl ester carboxylesterase
LGATAELFRARLCGEHNRGGGGAAILLGVVSPATRNSDPEAERRWWGNHLGELRWQLDAARLLAHPVLRGQGIPRGDGRSVLLLPGFLAGDYTLATMAVWLRTIGYRPSGVGFLTNTDCSERALHRLEGRADALVDEGGRRIAVIGHSRGAHLGKVLAVRRPGLVSHVIALGGGLSRQMAISAPTAAAVALVRAWHRHTTDRRERRGCLSEDCRCSFTRDYSAPFPESVRLTSIYSRGDGVVRWRSCAVPYADNVEVRGTHVGLAFNPQAYVAIATALAAPARR